jgi:hypothetical protein
MPGGSFTRFPAMARPGRLRSGLRLYCPLDNWLLDRFPVGTRARAPG